MQWPELKPSVAVKDDKRCLDFMENNVAHCSG
jgi:hypothetical protein